MKELKPKYDFKEVENGKYDFWLKGGFFEAGDLSKEPFTIVIPPPNVTGQLHMGHAFDETLQDILIRYKRMQGYSALWVPGTDHAGIATQIKVEAQLREEEGLTRYDLGRDKFLERVWDWKEKYGSRIINQLKKLHNIKQVKLLESGSSVERELMLIKVANTAETRSEIMAAVEIYRAKIIDYTTAALCIEVTGEPSKINAFIEVLKPLGIIEMCRTGVVALERGGSIMEK